MNPMLAKAAKPADLPKRLGWHSEPKLDGYRVLVQKRGNHVEVFVGRNGSKATAKLPWLVEAALVADFDFTVDGELVAVERMERIRERDVPIVVFHKVAEVMQSNPALAMAKQRNIPLTFVAFDTLDAHGQDLHDYPDQYRRMATEQIVRLLNLTTEQAMLIPRWPMASGGLVADLVGAGLEGVVLKNPLGFYRDGHRSGDWLKIKAVNTADVVVMGFKAGKGKFKGQVGAVVFGQYLNKVLIERGACSGMTDAERIELTEIGNDLKGRVIEVKYFGVSGADREGLRHPQFLRVRDAFDKKAEDCVWEDV